MTTIHDEPPLIICSTARIAWHVQQQLQCQQAETGQPHWQSAHVTTLGAWLSDAMEQSLLLGEIATEDAPMGELSSMQETILWEQAITASLKQHVAADLFDVSGLASAAQEANRLIIEWDLSLTPDVSTEETTQFLVWRQRFQSLCKASGMLESVRFRSWQLGCIEAGMGQLPSAVAMAGFDRPSPHILKLMQLLEQRGVQVSTHRLTYEEPQTCEQIALASQEAECRAAIAWAVARLQENPQAKLGIVVPELSVLRTRLAAWLDEAFHPSTIHPALHAQPRCYEFSLGTSLARQPIIHAAMGLLRLAWQHERIQQTDIAPLLHSPFWSNPAEANARAQLDADMRRTLPLTISQSRLLSYVTAKLEGEHPLPIAQLVEDFTALVNHANQQPKRLMPSAWMQVFESALAITHWPTGRSLSSVEYQALTAWQGVMTQLATLDHLLGQLTAQEALKRLYQACLAQIFQPESTNVPAIQLMGLLESVTEPLDAIWVMGMNDHQWPPLARPNALISATLQRDAGTPNSCSEVQLDYAHDIHARLIRSARHVLFSYAEKDGERELRPSPLLKDMPVLPSSVDRTLPWQTLAEQLVRMRHQTWEWLDDAQAPPVLEQEHVSGGTGLLKAQAICPAWAFYQYRLHARALDQAENGLDVMERGTLVHAVLAKFWSGKTSEDLLALSDQQLQTLIAEDAKGVLATFNEEKSGAFSEAFLNLEAERLTRLVCGWLMEVERKRPQGFEVVACEQAHRIPIEGIDVTLIVDRIDRLEDGRAVVMDYKTGRQLDFKNWAQARITEPQLPIYAAFLMGDSEVGAVCFAKVRISDYAFVGLAAAEELVQGAMVFNSKQGRGVWDEAQFPDWPSILAHWKTSITAIARAVKVGDAAVRFDDEKQLAYCEVLPLLRLPERQLQFERPELVTAYLTDAIQASSEGRTT